MLINFTTLATNALAFTLALAWNEAVSKTIGSLFPQEGGKGAAHAMVVYAIVVTIIVATIVIVLNNINKAIYVAKGGNLEEWLLEEEKNGNSPIVDIWKPE